MGDSIFEGPPKQNAKFLKQHGPRNAPKQSPEEGPKLDPKKVRKTCDFGVNFRGCFWLLFFFLALLGLSWLNLGLSWLILGRSWLMLGLACLILSFPWLFLGSFGTLLTRIGSLLAHPGPAVPHLELPWSRQRDSLASSWSFS